MCTVGAFDASEGSSTEGTVNRGVGRARFVTGSGPDHGQLLCVGACSGSGEAADLRLWSDDEATVPYDLLAARPAKSSPLMHRSRLWHIRADNRVLAKPATLNAVARPIYEAKGG